MTNWPILSGTRPMTTRRRLKKSKLHGDPAAKTALGEPSRQSHEPEGAGLISMGWWTHKGANLGPLQCEGNALPLSFASGNGVNRGRQSPRFTKGGASVSSD